MIKIQKVRLGFSNNNSSSHSFIIFGKDTHPDLIRDSEIDIGELFSSYDFVAASLEIKLLYFYLLLTRSLSENLTYREAHLVVCDLINKDELITTLLLSRIVKKDLTVNHTEHIYLPYKYSSEDQELVIDCEFIDEFTNMIMRHDFCILGGYDGTTHFLVEETQSEILSSPTGKVGYGQLISRKDSKTGLWTLFNTTTGAKVRFWFPGEDDTDFKYTDEIDIKLDCPEVVDIKITNFCPYGCSYCYQDSTVHDVKQDNNYHHICEILSILAEWGTFEISFGGGEPTTHKMFDSLLEYSRTIGIVPNFTTKSMEWMRDSRRNKNIIELCGSFAFSISSVEELKLLTDVFLMYRIPMSKTTIQIVLGIHTREEFSHLVSEILDATFGKVLLLGFKEVGRGKKYKKINYDWWMEEAIELGEKGVDIGIDTSLAQQYPDYLTETPDILYFTKEGMSSMYIDAVDYKCGPSSYCDKEQYSSLSVRHTDLKDILLESFNNYK